MADLIDAFNLLFAPIRISVIRSSSRLESLRGKPGDRNVLVARVVEQGPDMTIYMAAEANTISVVSGNRI